MKADSTVTKTEELLTAVADPQRRAILQYLRDSDSDVATVDELAAVLADEGSFGAGRWGSDQLRLNFRHVHLPKLADLGIVTFDARTSTVRYTGGERVAALLEFVAAELE